MSEKQDQQRKLRTAIGTCIGHHGYLENVRHVINNTTISIEDKLDISSAIDRFHKALRGIEQKLRARMNNL